MYFFPLENLLFVKYRQLSEFLIIPTTKQTPCVCVYLFDSHMKEQIRIFVEYPSFSFLCTFSLSSACPKPCVCSIYQLDRTLIEVSCAEKQLTSVPGSLPADANVL